ncbi:MAG TPA: PVC-type heme-binding CxxCH protein, partial [Gemmataceae bacterium]|nr:PVC-type heme-binding CxxCH protein [Gemmataceae bacterium]
MIRHSLAAIGVLLLATAVPAQDPGVLPTGPDGKPLNLDFETGTLKDWTATGDAFAGQPIRGDVVSRRRSDMKSRHQGEFWIGGWEKKGDAATGTLTSVPFTVTHAWASFLVGGGPYSDTCVELVRTDVGEVFFRASGLAEEDLRRVAVDLRPVMGKQILIRLVDKQTGHWGHVNFDDFRFHAADPKLPPRPAPREQLVAQSPPDEYKYAGLPPDKAAAAMTVPEGFTVSLFAGEPDVKQPIAFCLDDRGRLWVAEAYCYPTRKPYPGILLPENERKNGDRIVIFEDTKGTGHFDKKTVFMEGLNLLSGIEYGFGGIFVGAAPYFAFIPIDASGDKPAGPPQILLDGWGYEDTHEVLNTFTWGPDGWLYGCHGVFTHSRVGKPEAPARDRVTLNAGIWRYHPTRHTFEVFAEGTSNPWGLDFDEHGQMFIEACVIPHCWHIIQGGRYLRQAGPHVNPYTYADIQTIADHLHYVGATPHSGNNRSDSAGGGHAHCGLMIYQGGAWPAEYRGKIFMGNIHGRRINMDIPKPRGSGFVAAHGPDFLLANDAWARFINMRTGPDGNVYLIDWYDKQACHDKKQEIWDRSNGRIYKISHQDTKSVTGIDLTRKNDQELRDLALTSNNQWYVRHARRILQERRKPDNLAFEGLVRDTIRLALGIQTNDSTQLRALWALQAVGGFEDHRLSRGPRDKMREASSAWLRAWAVQLEMENGQEPAEELIDQLARLSRHEKSPIVRLYLASAAQQLPASKRWAIVENLAAHGEDIHDHNLPLMVWYAAEPLAAEDPARALDLAAKAKLPLLAFMVRRIAAIGTPESIALLVDHLGRTDDATQQRTILAGINEALKGRRRVEMPASWPAAFANLRDSKNGEVQNLSLALAVTFGDPEALTKLRETLADPKADSGHRHAALTALVGAKDTKLLPVLHRLMGDEALRGAAIKALANYDDPATPELLLKAYPSLSPAERRDVLNTLTSRPAYANTMISAIASKIIPPSDVSADIVRNLRNLRDPELNRRIGEVWGTVRDTPADRKAAIAKYKRMITNLPAVSPDLSHGRAIFAKTCQTCHTLYGVGGKVGPDITGSNRANLDYLLENILDPSAVIPKEYAATLITLKNGRSITGIVKEETAAALTVLTANETLTVSKADIDTREPSAVSMMPDDQLKPMSDDDVRCLVAYLQNPRQVPVLANVDNAKEFFNGKDLTGWIGDPKLWSVENGEIVGKSPGIKHNQFLVSDLVATDFKLSLKIKLVPNEGNSGVQFRSEPLPDGEMRGPQADAGAGWWGKLYEESAR